MERVILNATMAEWLPTMDRPFELCDELGRCLGLFIPQFERMEEEIRNEELDRRSSQTDEYSTEEIMAHLESLPCSK